jgi:hypothetical protein
MASIRFAIASVSRATALTIRTIIEVVLLTLFDIPPTLFLVQPLPRRDQIDPWGCFAYGVGGILVSRESLLGDGFLHALMWWRAVNKML